MPLTLAALLLWGLSAPGGWGCLQCDPLVRKALVELQAALVPAHFHTPQLQARAQDLLLGMQGQFFRDYALGAFVGMAEGPLLEELVNFREEMIKEFKKVLRLCELKACNRKICHLLKEEVLDCLNCQKVSPKCIRQKYCFVNRQPRVEFQTIGRYLRSQPLVGICMVILLALFFFFVMVISYQFVDIQRGDHPMPSLWGTGA